MFSFNSIRASISRVGHTSGMPYRLSKLLQGEGLCGIVHEGFSFNSIAVLIRQVGYAASPEQAARG